MDPPGFRSPYPQGDLRHQRQAIGSSAVQDADEKMNVIRKQPIKAVLSGDGEYERDNAEPSLEFGIVAVGQLFLRARACT